MNDPSQMLNRSYGIWQPQPQAAVPPPLPVAVAEEPMGFANRRTIFITPQGGLPGRISWKNKKAADKRKKAAGAAPGAAPVTGGGAAVSGYRPPTLNELQFQNRVKARRFYPKKKFSRFAPFAPRNTTSFIIRAKKSGGIASLVSPCPVTPAILPTPKFSPSRELLVDMAKEEWGVDGYGSMKGLIWLRSPVAGGSRVGGGGDEDEDVEDGSSESEVEEHIEAERKLDVSQFEMVYPNFGEEHGGQVAATAYLLENRVDDQDTHIARLEEENLTLKERLFLMEQDMGELRRRLLLLETNYRARNGENDNNNNNVGEDHNNSNDNDHGEENADPNTKEEASENDGGGDLCSEKSIGDHEESSSDHMHEE